MLYTVYREAKRSPQAKCEMLRVGGGGSIAIGISEEIICAVRSERLIECCSTVCTEELAVCCLLST